MAGGGGRGGAGAPRRARRRRGGHPASRLLDRGCRRLEEAGRRDAGGAVRGDRRAGRERSDRGGLARGDRPDQHPAGYGSGDAARGREAASDPRAPARRRPAGAGAGPGRQTAIVDGDADVHSIACASIVAKVCRDRLMCRLAKRYPEYGWATNKGYGTPEHREALLRYGPTPHHRRSFQPVEQLTLGLDGGC
jgi:hypothetical protein